MAMHTIKIDSNFSIFFDAQIRSTDEWSQTETVIVRPGLAYFFNKNVSLTFGIAYIENWRTVGSVRDGVTDNRLWQQLIINKPRSHSLLQHRLRLEERRIPTLLVQNNELIKSNQQFNARFRYLTRYMTKFSKTKSLSKGVYAALQNEFFINTLGGKYTNNKLVDQSRTYAGLGYRFGKTMDVEFGYMLQYMEGKSNVYSTNNILQLSSFLRL
jgi:hypothetical protein